MFSSALALLVMVQAQDPTAAPRRAYGVCLTEFVEAQVRERIAPEQFDTAVATACADREAALRAAIVRRGVAAGDRRPRAEADAATEIEDFRSMTGERYRDAHANLPPQ